MRLGTSFLKRTLLILVLALVASGASAVSYTLDQLVNGSVSSFTSENGKLTFSDFDITRLKGLSGDLTQYTVTVLADGFELSSPNFEATSGKLKKLDLTYRVTGTSAIVGAAMTMDATRETGRVKVEKDIEEPGAGTQGTFLLTLLRNNASLLSDSDTFNPGATTFVVEEAIRIKKVSVLHSVTNTYTVAVPEPAELTMLTAGLGGLIWLGRRRSQLQTTRG